MLPGGSSRTFCCRISQKASQTPVTWCNLVHVSPKVTNLEINWDNNKEQLWYWYDAQGTSKIMTNPVFYSTTVSACQLSVTCDTLKRHVQSQMPANSQSREWMWEIIGELSKWFQADRWLIFGLPHDTSWHAMWLQASLRPWLKCHAFHAES